MSAPAAKKDTFPLLRDLAVFAGALAFLAYSLRALPPPPPTVSAPTISAANRLLASRQPASLAPLPAADSSVAQTEFSCLPAPGSAREQTTTARLYRLQSPLCGAGAVTVRNETTGEHMVVFTIGERWVTNYFPLAEGANDLLVEWKEKGKLRQQRLKVTRSLAST